MRSMIYLLAGFLLVACAPRTEVADSAAHAGTAALDAVSGIVRVIGSAPVNVQVVVESEHAGSVRVVGAPASELARLAGAEVTVRGALRAAPDPLVTREMEVLEYTIDRVDGRPVIAGEVVAIDTGVVRLRTSAGEDVYLSGAPADWRVGQKVWVQGPRSVIVQSYGTVRP